MLQYIYFFITFLVTCLIYLHIQRQYYFNSNIDSIPYIDDVLTKTQFQELCYEKYPFVYKYNISFDEKIVEKESLLSKYSNYDVESSDKKISINELFDASMNELQNSYSNEEFLKESEIFDILYKKDDFLRPSLTCYYSYDLLISQTNNDYLIYQNKCYGNYIHCIENPLTIKLVSPKYSTFFEPYYNNGESISKSIFDHKKLKPIPLFNEELMKSDKQYCKIHVNTVTLYPGDLLYIPCQWFYAYNINHVEHQKNHPNHQQYNISIAYKYVTYMNTVLFYSDIYSTILKQLQSHLQKLIKINL